MTSVCLCEHQELRQETQNEAQITTRWGTIQRPFLSSAVKTTDRQICLEHQKMNWNKLRTNDKQTLWCFYPLQSIVYRLRVIDISIKETRPVMGRKYLDWLGQFFKQQVQTWQLLGTGVSYQSSILRTRYNVCPYLYIYVVTRIIDQSDSTRIE